MSTYDPTDLRGQELSRAEDAARKKLASESEESDVKWLMGSKRGRQFIWRLLEQAGVFQLSFDPNAMRMAFNEGNRNYGNRVLALIHKSSPELYPVMVKEQNNARSNDGNGHKSN